MATVTIGTVGKRVPSFPINRSCEPVPKRPRALSGRLVALDAFRREAAQAAASRSKSNASPSVVDVPPRTLTPTTTSPILTPNLPLVSARSGKNGPTTVSPTSTTSSTTQSTTTSSVTVSPTILITEVVTITDSNVSPGRQESPVSDSSSTPPGSSAPASTSPPPVLIATGKISSNPNSNSASTTTNKSPCEHFDMFSESPVAIPQPPVKFTPDVCTDDRWDAGGQYKICTGEVLNDRYVVTGVFGDGIYSRVLRATDRNHNDQEVAIKCHRLNMKKAAQNEKKVLETINEKDTKDSSHCIRLLDSFEDKYGTLCLVFEAMGSNLRQVLQQHKTKTPASLPTGSATQSNTSPQPSVPMLPSGSGPGLSIRLVSQYARAMLLALRHLKSLSLVHCDIKLDNVLLSPSSPLLCKLADFGCAVTGTGPRASGTAFARFYRPPESILGAPVCYSCDMWAFGCCIYELATSRFPFCGSTNEEMLWLHMQVTGRPSLKLLRQFPKTSNFFDSAVYRSPPTPPPSDTAATAAIQQFTTTGKATRDLKAEIMRHASGVRDSLDKALYTQLADLVSQIFAFDPTKRIKVEEALSHPFVVVLDDVLRL